MHIAFLTSEYPHPKINQSAGLGTSIKNLATELTKLKHKVSVFVYSQDVTEVFDNNGITIHKTAYKKHTILSWYFYRKDIQEYINKIIQNENIQLLEAPDWTGITAFMKFRCPLVIRLHGSDAYFCHLENRKQKKKNYFFEMKGLKSADEIVSVSEFTAQKTISIFRLQKKIEVIHNGIDIENFSVSKLPNENKNLLYFGSIIRKKGVLELARIFNFIVDENPDAQLTLLGKDVIDIFENQSTLTLFRGLLSDKAKQQVIHVSEVPYNEVKEHIETASVVVLPSFAEAFPMTWLEAMAMGKALVTSNIGWATELMIDGETGFIEDPINHQLYANKILQLLNDSTLNNSMGMNARKHIEQNFSQQKMTKQNIVFYKKIIDSEIA